MVLLSKGKVEAIYSWSIQIDGRRLTIPRHDPIKIGVLKAIIEQAKTTQEEFLKYMW